MSRNLRFHLPTAPKDFNAIVCWAIDDTIVEVLGHRTLEALHDELTAKYSVVRNELPYRTETLYQILEASYGIVGAKTVGVEFAKKLYQKLGIPFHLHEGYQFSDYITEAKSTITAGDSPHMP